MCDTLHGIDEAHAACCLAVLHTRIPFAIRSYSTALYTCCVCSKLRPQVRPPTRMGAWGPTSANRAPSQCC